MSSHPGPARRLQRRRALTFQLWPPTLAAFGLLLLAPSVRAAAPEAPEPIAKTPAEAIGWDDMVREVERRHPLMKAARQNLKALEARLHQAEWAWFPAFRLEAGGFPATTDFEKWGYIVTGKLKMVQPVYTFGKIETLKRAGRHGVDVGRAGIEVARWELRYRMAQAWFGWLLGKELRDILEDGKKWLEKARSRMERLRDEDSDDYNQNEHLRLKARVADFHAMDAQNSLLETQAREGMRLLVGRARGGVVRPAAQYLEPLEYHLASAERYVELAHKNQPQLRMARSGLAARQALHANKKAELWPSLVLVGEVSLTDSDVVNIESSTYGNDTVQGVGGGALLAVRWDLDVAQRVLRVDQARAEARKAAHEVGVTQQVVELKVRELRQDLENKRRLLGYYMESQKAAQGWLMANWDLYEDGFGEFRDVMDALVQFYTKKVAYLQMVYEHNVLVYELSRAVGSEITALAKSDAAPAPKAPGKGSESTR